MHAIVERLDDEELIRPVNESWTVAGVLGHVAFWDGRALSLGALARAFEDGVDVVLGVEP